jgi:hypothetical protein
MKKDLIGLTEFNFNFAMPDPPMEETEEEEEEGPPSMDPPG